MTHEWKSTDDRFDCNIVDLLFEKFDIESFFFKLFEDASERSFMADAHIAAVAVEDKFGVVFVYCVVC